MILQDERSSKDLWERERSYKAKKIRSEKIADAKNSRPANPGGKFQIVNTCSLVLICSPLGLAPETGPEPGTRNPEFAATFLLRYSNGGSTAVERRSNENA